VDSQLNKIAYITGVSGGIGKALSLELLNAGFFVYGIGRSNNIKHPNFEFIPLDLRKIDLVQNFNFFQRPAAQRLLINNAGMIGKILPVGELSASAITDVMNVNAIAPQILINTFIQTFANQTAPLHILNISSGAGKRPIDAWAPYCASKAALDIFAETVKLEMELREIKNFFIHSVAPGVVDTGMQVRIRAASPEKFKASQRFHDLKNNGGLITPEHVSQRLLRLISEPARFPNNILSLTDID
jgi:benzil reductase ((S)-benzoin forming)